MIKTLSTLLLFILFFVGFSATPNTELETTPEIENTVDHVSTQNLCWWATITVRVSLLPTKYEKVSSRGNSKAAAKACAISWATELYGIGIKVITTDYTRASECERNDPRYSID